MTNTIAGALVLWTYALAALLFGMAALAAWRRGGALQRMMAGTLLLTSLWALTVAGIDAHEVGPDLAAAIRNLAWLGMMAVSVRRSGSGHGSLAALYVIVAAVMAGTALVAIAGAAVDVPEAARALGDARSVFAMMGAAGALVLLHQIVRDPRSPKTGSARVIVIALSAMWTSDLIVALGEMADAAMGPGLFLARGLAMVGVAMLLSTNRLGAGEPTLSRSVAVRAIGGIALVLYAGLTAFGAHVAGLLAPDHARIVQTAIVIGATTALLTLMSTPWLRAWFRVKVAKHLFTHRYDYRVEWQRVTATLGASGEGTAPLATRTIKALADLVDAPAGLLLRAQDGGLVPGGDWNWAEASGEGGETMTRYLRDTGRLVVVDDVMDVVAAGVPEWLTTNADAWFVLPLLHAEALVGAIVLARPPVERALDWEDFDLLRVAGRQAASFLAEDRLRTALDEARRFDEFNRRFAFLLHDIKNVASQLTLVARNAERHADNAEFRSDMVATLKDSSGRMATLLSRLGQHDGARPEPTQPVDVATLIGRVVAARRAQHPVTSDLATAPLVLAQPLRLEQVLSHLIQNAVEASATDRPVTIAIERTEDDVAIVVADRGSGMSADFVRDELFRPFVSTKPGGFGIGAYEARQLVVGMGGQLTVESRVGEGTRFRIVLPVAPALEVAA